MVGYPWSFASRQANKLGIISESCRYYLQHIQEGILLFSYYFSNKVLNFGFGSFSGQARTDVLDSIVTYPISAKQV